MSQRRFQVLAFGVFVCVLGSCGDHSRGPTVTRTVVAETAVGSDGGGLAITTGRLAGLELVIPPGALTQPVTVRAVVEDVSLPPGVFAAGFGPGLPVRLEPETLEFAVPARLTLPYRRSAVLTTAPGNVLAVRYLADGDERLVPDVVDVVDGRIQIDTLRLGHFSVVEGPQRPRHEYLPADGAVVPLEGGWTFAAEDMLLPHASIQGATRWSIHDHVDHSEGFYIRDFSMLGRFSEIVGWDEIWNEPLSMVGVFPGSGAPVATETVIFEPRSAAAPAAVGAVVLEGRWSWVEPVQIGGLFLRDVMEVRMHLQWTRPDGNGSREVAVLLAPDVGLLALEIDGVVRARTDL